MLNSCIFLIVAVFALFNAAKTESYFGDSVPLIKLHKPMDPAVLKDVMSLLTKHFKTSVQLVSMVQITRPTRRNMLIRMVVETPPSKEQFNIMFKQSQVYHDGDTDSDIFSRFAREWVGLEYLADIPEASDDIPKFYGGNKQHRFILMEDMGVALSLLGYLMPSSINRLKTKEVIDAEGLAVKLGVTTNKTSVSTSVTKSVESIVKVTVTTVVETTHLKQEKDSNSSGEPVYTVEMAVKDFFRRLGKFHGDSYGEATAKYQRLIHALDPNADEWEPNFKHNYISIQAGINRSLDMLRFHQSAEFAQDVYEITMSSYAPGPLVTVIHGDMCPDNVLLYPNFNFTDVKNDKWHEHTYVYDFEWAGVRNPLLDATKMHVGYPGCWAKGVVPMPLLEHGEELYRLELAKKIPAANDMDVFNTYLVDAVAFRVLKIFSSVRKYVEQHRRGVKPVDQFSQSIQSMFTIFEAFINISDKHNKRRHLNAMAKDVFGELKKCFPDGAPLPLYEAFLPN